MSKKVIVCGAGWAGLNAARILLESGLDVIVLEKSERVGGRITSDYKDGFTLDRGFQVINPAYAELIETGVLDDVEFFHLPKAIEICNQERIFRVGDFRRDPRFIKDLLSSKTGKLTEKLQFLNYLRKRSEDVTLETALIDSRGFFDRVLKPFLDGVFLMDSRQVSNRMARELIHWFIKGRPGVPSTGVREVSEKMSAGIDIEFAKDVRRVGATEVFTEDNRYEADAVINALDPITAAKLLGRTTPVMNESHTWYFTFPEGEISSKLLRVGGDGPIVNSIVISNLARTYAPPGRALLAATTLGLGSEAEVRAHLSQQWKCESRNWNLIEVYRIKNSLPFHPPGKPLSMPARDESGVYLAGDWRSTPSQQGALLSGKLAAQAVISDLLAR